MLKIETTNRFDKDIKRIKRRGKNLEKLKRVIQLLEHEKPLPASCQNHPLKGNYKGYYDLHIEPDWLLIYKIQKDRLILSCTGSHSDLF